MKFRVEESFPTGKSGSGPQETGKWMIDEHQNHQPVARTMGRIYVSKLSLMLSVLCSPVTPEKIL